MMWQFTNVNKCYVKSADKYQVTLAQKYYMKISTNIQQLLFEGMLLNPDITCAKPDTISDPD